MIYLCTSDGQFSVWHTLGNQYVYCIELKKNSGDYKSSWVQGEGCKQVSWLLNSWPIVRLNHNQDAQSITKEK